MRTTYKILKGFDSYEPGQLATFGPGMAQALLSIQAIRAATPEDVATVQTKPAVPPALETKPAPARVLQTKAKK